MYLFGELSLSCGACNTIVVHVRVRTLMRMYVNYVFNIAVCDCICNIATRIAFHRPHSVVGIFLQAISHPSNDANQDSAWHAVVPLVSHLKQFYQYSQALGKF